MNVEIIRKDEANLGGDLFITGKCGGFEFTAKVTEGRSGYGYQGGRVRTFAMGKSGTQTAAADYNGGWGRKPHTEEEREVFAAIMAAIN